MKIAMIGAGSIVFTRTLLNDMMATPALEGATYALMAPTETKLRRMEAFAKRKYLSAFALELDRSAGEYVRRFTERARLRS